MGRLAWAFAAAALLLLGGCAVFAPDIPYAELEARHGSPASRYLDLPDGVRVHYRDQGGGDTPIVLVHGFAASLHAWEPWVAEFADERRVITLDLPGHGLTRAPEGYRASLAGHGEVVDAVVGRLGVERFVLGGNSMGGAVAWSYALARPEKVEALVLVDPAGWPGEAEGSGPPLAFRLLGNPVGRALLRHVNPRLVAREGLERAYADPAAVTPALVDRYVDLARAPGHRAILTSPRAEPAEPVTPATFARIRTPTLILHGEADALIPLSDSQAMAAAIPGAKLITYPGLGHVPMETAPERTAEDVRRFLAELPEAG